MSKYGYLEVYQKVPLTSSLRESTVFRLKSPVNTMSVMPVPTAKPIELSISTLLYIVLNLDFGSFYLSDIML